VGLINLKRRNKWLSPFSPNFSLNSPCLYPHSIQSNSPLEPPGRCFLLRNLSNPYHKRKPSSSTWEKSKAQRRMNLLCKVKSINIRNININTKGKLMQIQRRKGTQNPSSMPPDPMVEREEKGRNAHIVTKDSIQNPHACKNK
jgi:hypothetical protein